MLAIVFSLEKFNQYTFGRLVQSNHKPLESILKIPGIDAIRRMRVEYQDSSCVACYVPFTVNKSPCLPISQWW